MCDRSRFWCFTINNPDPADVVEIPDYEYLIIGQEVGESGTPHLQGYVEFKKRLRLQQVKKLLPRAHLETRRGTALQAADYCKKEGNFHEDGKLSLTPGESEKERWEHYRQLAKKGDFDEIPAHIYIRYRRALIEERQSEVYAVDELTDTCGVWIWGQPGTGKSRYARDTYKELYLKMQNKWWNGYEGQDTVLIEDWDPETRGLNQYLKLWTDRYPFPAETKGGVLPSIRPKQVVITSNYPLDQCFTGQDLAALTRRLKVINM